MNMVHFWKIAIWIYTLLALTIVHASPVDSFRQMPRGRLLSAAGTLYNGHIYRLDSAGAFQVLDELAGIAAERKVPELKTYTVLLKGRYSYDNFEWTDSQSLKYCDEVLAAKNATKSILTEALFLKGAWHYNIGAYPLAFEYMLKANAEAEKTGYRDMYAAGALLFRLGGAMFHHNQPRMSISYVQEALQLPGIGVYGMVNVYNTLGLAYSDVEQYDSAIYCFRKALEHIGEGRKDSLWIGNILGNLGWVYYCMGNFDTAVSLLTRDYMLNVRNGLLEGAGNAASLLFRMHLLRNDMTAADSAVSATMQLLPHMTNNRRKAEFYQMLLLYYKKKGDAASIMMYVDSFALYTRNYANDRQRELLEKARRKAETDAYVANIRLLESERKRQVLVRNTVIFIFILLFIIIIQVLRKIQFTRKKERDFFEIEKRRKDDELQNAKNLLNTYLEHLKQKQQLVEQFTREIEDLQKDSGNSAAIAEKEELLKRLQTATILTEDDWVNFRKLFTRVYSDFFIKLDQKFPNLTQAEIRLLALSKLGLSVNEQATMIGISPDSVRRTRQRLVKKTSLQVHEITQE